MYKEFGIKEGIIELSKETSISFLSVVQHKKSLLSKYMMTFRGVCLTTLPAISIPEGQPSGHIRNYKNCSKKLGQFF